MAIPFCKFHGFGNEYIVLNRSDIGDAPLEELAVEICASGSGVGADGLAVLEELDGSVSDYFCEIVNPDGSLASFSGNGTRCAAAYLHYKELWIEKRLRLETLSGVKNYDLLEVLESGEYLFEAEIGQPKFASNEIPVVADPPRESVIDEPIEIDGAPYEFSAVNVGNPVACIFVDDFDLDWRSVGRAIETHERFPERINVVFVRVIDADNIDIRIWERGAGETSSSGTCSSAAAVMSAYLAKTSRRLSVHADGGTTEVLWRDDDEMVITGSAELMFCGEW